jgi:hypothetical protein
MKSRHESDTDWEPKYLVGWSDTLNQAAYVTASKICVTRYGLTPSFLAMS